ncbi:MAG: type II toxin-antitoxin system VapC family toxin, partial [Nitrospirota bacterium]
MEGRKANRPKGYSHQGQTSFGDHFGGKTLILYLDTSSIVKLYIEEAGSDAVRRWAGEAEVLATCRIAYPELISALNRRLRGG